MRAYYESGDQRAPRVEELFTKIARRYDLINDVQSFGLHRVWKKKLLRLAKLTPEDSLLDLATGTGDLLRMAALLCPSRRRLGLDFSFAMLKAGRDGAPLIQGDIQNLPVRDGEFSVVTMAYGLRNVADRGRALEEIVRVLRPSGRLVFLEFSKPKNSILRALYFRWLKTVQPFLGKLFFNDRETYLYIWRSLMEYPEIEGVSRELESAGFSDVQAYSLFLGMMSIHVAYHE